MYNLTVQRMLPKNISLEAGYVGGQSHKLSYAVGNYNVSNHLSSEIGKVQTLLPVGKSNYSALQVKVDRRYGNGWSVLAAYTYAHSLDNGPAPFDLTSSSAPQNPFDLDPEYATSAADLKHNVTSEQPDRTALRTRQTLSPLRRTADRCAGRRMAPELDRIVSYRHTGQHRLERRICRLSRVAAQPGAWEESQSAARQAHDSGMVQHCCVHQHAGAEQQRSDPWQCGAESRSRPRLHQRRLLAVEEFLPPEKNNPAVSCGELQPAQHSAFRQSECQPQLWLLWFHYLCQRPAYHAVRNEAHLLIRRRLE